MDKNLKRQSIVVERLVNLFQPPQQLQQKALVAEEVEMSKRPTIIVSLIFVHVFSSILNAKEEPMNLVVNATYLQPLIRFQY